MKKMIQVLATLCVAVLILSGCGGSSSVTDHLEIATVAGVVTDGTTSLPLQGVTVQIDGKSGNTNDVGFYSIDGVTTGNHIINAALTGYVDYTGTCNVDLVTVDCNIEMTPIADATFADLVTGQNFIEIDTGSTVAIQFGVGGVLEAQGSDGNVWSLSGNWTSTSADTITFDFGADGNGSFVLLVNNPNALSVQITDSTGSTVKTWAKTEAFVDSDVANKTFALSDVAGETATFDGSGGGQIYNPTDGTFSFSYTITGGVLRLDFTDGWASELYKLVSSTATVVSAGVVDYDTLDNLDDVSTLTFTEL